METIQCDLVAPAVVAAIESNLFALYRSFGLWPKAVVHDDQDMLWSLTDIPFPLFNGVLRAHFAPHTVDTAINSAKLRCAEKKVPMLWWTGPSTTPKNLPESLELHGFEGRVIPGMAVDLDALPHTIASPDGLVISAVKDSADAEIWCRVLCAGFAMPAFVGVSFCDYLSSVGFAERAPFRHYLGWLNGVPVATSSIFYGAGVAGAYNVTTIPSARRKGIGTAMTLHGLLQARTAGFQVGVLHSSPAAVNVYRALGFAQYCDIGQYTWSSEDVKGGHLAKANSGNCA